MAFSLAVMGFDWAIDPFHLYRPGGTYVVDETYQRYVNAGLIKSNNRSGAVIIGSSYVSNFDPALATRLFGQDTQLISLYGASQRELDLTLSYALRHDPNLRIVFLDTSIWNVCNLAWHPSLRFPEDLYRDAWMGDAKYLYSGETAILSARLLIHSWFGAYPALFSSRVADVHRWYESYARNFGNPTILEKKYLEEGGDLRPAQPDEAQIQAGAERIADCFDANILQIVRSRPEVRFYLFNPPVFQWLLWTRQRAGLIEIWNRAQDMIAARIEPIGNVFYFDFYAADSIVGDCRKFMDMSHFDLASSDNILRWIHDGRYRRTAENGEAMDAAVMSELATRVACHPAER